VLELLAVTAPAVPDAVLLADELSVFFELDAFELGVLAVDAVVRVVDTNDDDGVAEDKEGVAEEGDAEEGDAVEGDAEVGDAVAELGEDSADVPAVAWDTVPGTGVKGWPQVEEEED